MVRLPSHSTTSGDHRKPVSLGEHSLPGAGQRAFLPELARRLSTISSNVTRWCSTRRDVEHRSSLAFAEATKVQGQDIELPKESRLVFKTAQIEKDAACIDATDDRDRQCAQRPGQRFDGAPTALA